MRAAATRLLIIGIVPLKRRHIPKPVCTPHEPKEAGAPIARCLRLDLPRVKEAAMFSIEGYATKKAPR
jgi:hypothetical protein